MKQVRQLPLSLRRHPFHLRMRSSRRLDVAGLYCREHGARNCGAKWPRGGGESQALLAAGARPAGQEAREEAAEATRELLKEKIDHDL